MLSIVKFKSRGWSVPGSPFFFTFFLSQKDLREKIIKFWSFAKDWVRSLTVECSIYFEIKKV